MEMIKRERSILMFPFMADGHINPFMSLARKLEGRKGFTITFVNTPLNIQKLKSSVPSSNNIDFVEIPFHGTEYGLPPNVENTNSLSFDTVPRLIEASRYLRSPFKSLIVGITERNGHPPACIISDMLMGWTVEVANELGIYHSVFIAGSGYGMAVYFSLYLSRCHFKNKDEFLLPDFPEAGIIQQSQLGIDLKFFRDCDDPFFIYLTTQLSLCFQSDAILLNSIENLGQLGVTYFSRKMAGKPVWQVGPACSILKKDNNEEHQSIAPVKLADSFGNLSSWLDLHPPASVLYICFGSQNSILASQMMELALGLEASGKAFIWVIRPPIGFNPHQEFQAEWLPAGFEERMRQGNKGILVNKYAPQKQILSHKAIGAFLSHCGWNSVLESLSLGVPVIGWPLYGDQTFNCHMLEKEAGVCVELNTGFETVTHEHVARVIKTVMESTEKGEEMKRKTREIKVKMEDALREEDGHKGSSIRATDELLDAAIATTKKPSDLGLH